MCAQSGGERWRSIGDDKKRQYEEKARQAKERYDREVAEYKKQGGGK